MNNQVTNNNTTAKAEESNKAKKNLTPPPPLQDSIILEKEQGKGDGLKLDFSVLLNYNFQMKNVSEKEKDMYLNLLQETFGENLNIIRRDVKIVQGLVDNSVEISVKSPNLEKAVETKDLVNKINENFINHYIKDDSKLPRVKFGINVKIDANGLLKQENYYFQNIMCFGDLLTTNLPQKKNDKEAFAKAISNEWSNHIFINPKYRDKFADYDNILKLFERSRHTKIWILDENNPSANIFEVKLDIFKNFNYIYSTTNMIVVQEEDFYASDFLQGYICLLRNNKKEITNVINRHFSKNKYLAYQYLSLILKNIGTNWVIDKFVELNNKIFNSDIKLVDKILKRTIVIDSDFLGKVDKRKAGKFGKKDNKNNDRFNSENQTYQPFKNIFNEKKEEEQKVETPSNNVPTHEEEDTPPISQEENKTNLEADNMPMSPEEEMKFEASSEDNQIENQEEDGKDSAPEAEDESNQI